MSALRFRGAGQVRFLRRDGWCGTDDAGGGAVFLNYDVIDWGVHLRTREREREKDKETRSPELGRHESFILHILMV